MTDTQGTTAEHSQRYTADMAAAVEKKWQDTWAERQTFYAPNPVGDLADPNGTLPADKLFIQDMFPYPSGTGLHVGHPLGYIATDVYARYHRMQGKNVLHTLGYDAFGLPAEQYAIQTGTHPRDTTVANIANMQRQLGRLGLGHDPRRAISTITEDYYRWTQWIFLQIFNAWYDEDTARARPIAELEAEFASGQRAVTAPHDGVQWAELTVAQQQDVLAPYRLVYQSESTVNWCPGLGTVLANEEVTAEGRSERGNFPVFRKRLKQWMMRITAYADRLVSDLEYLDWPDKVKAMQRNWIGRSTGAQVRFAIGADSVEVYTTRPDTLFGASYVVLAPEHDLVDTLAARGAYTPQTDPRWTGGAATPAEAVAAYRASIAAKSDLERQEGKDKTGVFLGVNATNPVNGAQVPVFIADYVLTGYGTGAIMSVPAHDARDYDFATAFGLPLVQVVDGEGDLAEGPILTDGVAVNSANDAGLDLNGLDTAAAKEATIAWLSEAGLGEAQVQYKLRDWLFARQRYWGEPFPVVLDAEGRPYAVPESCLPVRLPDIDDYAPTAFDPEDADTQPSPPLARAEDWLTVELDLGDGLKDYRHDTNVMPQWAGSSWYQLRYIDPTNEDAFCDPVNEAYWTGPRPELHGPNDPGGVDLYVGGVEHAVLHLLYSRFWQKVLFDLGYVSSSEPYRRLFNQGYIQAFAYTDERGAYVPAAEVSERDGQFFYTDPERGEIPVRQEYGKMGKSLKNSVSPDEICDAYGADTLRVYEMQMGPLDTSRPWATKDVIGAHRFLQRLWRVIIEEDSGQLRATAETLDETTDKLLHRTIAGVSDDYANLRYNTAIAKLIELTNHLTKQFAGQPVPREAGEALVLLVAPVAPHLAEELWSRLGHTESLAHGPFPVAEESKLVEDMVTYPVQVNGKVRARIEVPAEADREQVTECALATDNVRAHLGDAAPKKVIVVPGKMVNIVL